MVLRMATFFQNYYYVDLQADVIVRMVPLSLNEVSKLKCLYVKIASRQKSKTLDSLFLTFDPISKLYS